MCGKSHRADTVVVSALIMLLGRLMDRRGASGEVIFERTHTQIQKEEVLLYSTRISIR